MLACSLEFPPPRPTGMRERFATSSVRKCIRTFPFIIVLILNFIVLIYLLNIISFFYDFACVNNYIFDENVNIISIIFKGVNYPINIDVLYFRIHV